MRFFTLFVLVVSVVLTFLAVGVLKPSSAIAYVVWTLYLVGPYVAMAWAMWRSRAVQYGVLALCALATFALFDTLYLHPDPQGALFIALIPIFQSVVLGVLWGVFRAGHSTQTS